MYSFSITGPKVLNSDFTNRCGLDSIFVSQLGNYDIQNSEFVLVFHYWFLAMKVLNSDSESVWTWFHFCYVSYIVIQYIIYSEIRVCTLLPLLVHGYESIKFRFQNRCGLGSIFVSQL